MGKVRLLTASDDHTVWLRELEPAGDAASRGWEREVERHRRAAARIQQLLGELNEPLEEGEHVGG